MLVLTQLGVGAIALEAARARSGGRRAGGPGDRDRRDVASARPRESAPGRPLYAFRVVLGLRTSWMSREIVRARRVRGRSSAFAACSLAAAVAPDLAAHVPRRSPARAVARRERVATGALAVFCSVMIYADTRRPLWRFRIRAPLFALTCLVGAGALGVAHCAGERRSRARAGLAISGAISVAKMRFESRLAAHLADPSGPPLKRSACSSRVRCAGSPGARRHRLDVRRGAADRGRIGTRAPSRCVRCRIAGAALAGNTFAEWLERQLLLPAQSAPAMPGRMNDRCA
jgi:hypothetical protein